MNNNDNNTNTNNNTSTSKTNESVGNQGIQRPQTVMSGNKGNSKSQVVSVGVRPKVSVSVRPKVSVGVSPEVSVGVSSNVSVGVSSNVSVGVSSNVSVGVSPEVSVGVGDKQTRRLGKRRCGSVPDSLYRRGKRKRRIEEQVRRLKQMRERHSEFLTRFYGMPLTPAVLGEVKAGLTAILVDLDLRRTDWYSAWALRAAGVYVDDDVGNDVWVHGGFDVRVGHGRTDPRYKVRRSAGAGVRTETKGRVGTRAMSEVHR